MTASPRRIAAVVGTLAGALVVGVGLSLAVDAIRVDPRVAQPPSASPLASASARPSTEAASLAPLPTATATPTAPPSATASPTLSPSPTPTPTPSPTAIPTVVPTASPSPTPVATPPPAPTPDAGGCDVVTVDDHGTIHVNGQAVDASSEEFGEAMPLAVLRLAARAAASASATVCLDVQLPEVIVTGMVEVCGEVVADRQAPIETPPPAEPGPTMPPTYGLPTIGGVEISDRMLDVNSYPLLDVADVWNAPACLHVQSDANDVRTTLSLAFCPSARLDADGTLTIFIGEEEWSFEPEYVYDEDQVLVIGETVDAGLDIRNYKDDVIHLVEMGVWVTPGCPWQ